MRSYASHLLQHIGGNALQARLKCIAKCDAIPDKLCPVLCRIMLHDTPPSMVPVAWVKSMVIRNDEWLFAKYKVSCKGTSG